MTTFAADEFEVRVNLTQLQRELGYNFVEYVDVITDGSNHTFDATNITSCGQEQQRGCVLKSWTCADAHNYLADSLQIYVRRRSRRRRGRIAFVSRCVPSHAMNLCTCVCKL